MFTITHILRELTFFVNVFCKKISKRVSFRECYRHLGPTALKRFVFSLRRDLPENLRFPVGQEEGSGFYLGLNM